MATLKERIVLELTARAGLSDRQLADQISGTRSRVQPINQACRQLAAEGILDRRRGSTGLQNHLTGKPSPRRQVKDSAISGSIPEDFVKQVVGDWLAQAGWAVQIAWGRERGIDIHATRGDQRLLIEAKGTASRYQVQRNFFYSVIGDIAQKMNDEHWGYALAIPDTRHHRSMWDRLPRLAKCRLQLACIFVDEGGRVDFDPGGSGAAFGTLRPPSA